MTARELAREYGVAIRFADLGDWGEHELRSEYDPALPEIRVHLRLAPGLVALGDRSRALSPSRGNRRGRRAADSRGARSRRRCLRPRTDGGRRMSLLFAGIDGGQSSTVAAIADETGRVLARGRAGPADEIGEGPSSTRLRDALRAALPMRAYARVWSRSVSSPRSSPESAVTKAESTAASPSFARRASRCCTMRPSRTPARSPASRASSRSPEPARSSTRATSVTRNERSADGGRFSAMREALSASCERGSPA